MARLCKCYGCENKFDKSVLEKISSKNYCPSCAKIVKQRKIDREELINTISDLYNISYPTGLMLKQIKEFEEIRGYKLKGITLTLLYCKNQLNTTFHQRYGLGIVPLHYESAKKYWIDKSRRAKNHVDFVVQEQTMKIPRIQVQNDYKKEMLIDLEDILCSN